MLLHDTNDAPSPVLGIERRGALGVPNTAIPYEKLVNTEIPCRK